MWKLNISLVLWIWGGDDIVWGKFLKMCQGKDSFTTSDSRRGDMIEKIPQSFPRKNITLVLWIQRRGDRIEEAPQNFSRKKIALVLWIQGRGDNLWGKFLKTFWGKK